jgi:hypothetical protein
MDKERKSKFLKKQGSRGTSRSKKKDVSEDETEDT